MAFAQVITVLLFALALARIGPSACQTVEGKVSCTDCTHNYDFSGIKLSVKCEGVKNLAVATTEDNGFFKVDLPSDHTKSPSANCFAKLVGGPNHLYASKKNQVSQIVKGKEKSTYTISTPLSFFTSCPQNTECNKAANLFGSSKTFDLPLPPEWGLAPTSYYVPFFPIIGIP
ncbi:Pollen Ole e 1 allergen/extensin [Spatholobus suberectus]|nr:Pollen Ole e 1 allergen/extensin [Spatholobus suberectus]